MHKRLITILSVGLTLLLAFSLQAQVLGPCGGAPQPGGKKKMAPHPPKHHHAPMVQPIPLPGQKAIDFKLKAVVGDEIKEVKLSDYAGKWRVLCFFPAAFTFV